MKVRHNIGTSRQAESPIAVNAQMGFPQLLFILTLSLLALSLVALALPLEAWAAEDAGAGSGAAISDDIEPEQTWSTTGPEFGAAGSSEGGGSHPYLSTALIGFYIHGDDGGEGATWSTSVPRQAADRKSGLSGKLAEDALRGFYISE